MCKVTLQFDPLKAEEVAAAKSVFDAITGQKVPTEKPVAESRWQKSRWQKSRWQKSRWQKKPVAEKPKKEVKPRHISVKPPELGEPEPEEMEEPEPEEGEIPTKEELRVLLSEKVGVHRAEIKNKLTKLGAANITALDEKKHIEFKKYLNTLK